MNLPKCLLLIPLFLVYACAQKQLVQTQALPVGMAINEEALLQAIAFGSCDRQDLDKPMWTYIHKDDRDLWIWLCDSINADPDDMAALEAMYAQQKSKAGYQKLLNSCPVIGIWDDHDYGLNDGGKEFSKKSESKDLMLNFLDVQDTAAVRSSTGAYQSYTIGPAGKRVNIILLDTR